MGDILSTILNWYFNTAWVMLVSVILITMAGVVVFHQNNKYYGGLVGQDIGTAVFYGIIGAPFLPLIVGIVIVTFPLWFWITAPGEWVTSKIKKLLDKIT